MKKRYLRQVTAVSLLMLSAQVGAQEIRGMQSCGEWVRERQGGPTTAWERVVSRSWLIGYLSGKVSVTGKNIFKGTDNESLALWMDNYCRSNPLKDIQDGAEVLFYELVRQKNL